MLRPSGRRLALVVAAALLAAACEGTDDSSPSADRPSTAPTGQNQLPRADPIDFSDCTDVIQPQIEGQEGSERNLSFGCGTLQVPLDYDDPEAKSLDIYVVRVRMADQVQREGSIVINPGGPGGSGLDAAVGLALSMPTEVLTRFDLVGFDPRGVGLSEPLRCISGEQKDALAAADPFPRDAAALARDAQQYSELTDGCWDKYGDRLEHFNTTSTVQDMDLLRQGLDEDKLTYLGFSYGTLLGAVYAEMFPDKVRALVLDGAVDPAEGAADRSEAQAKGFEDAFNQFAAACRSQGAQCPIGPDARKSVMGLLAKARARPIPTSQAGDDRMATAGNVHLAVLSALYDQGKWPDLAKALAEAGKGDAKGVFALDDEYNQRTEDGKFGNILDANFVINCNDYTDEVTPDVAAAKLAEWTKKYPLFGPASASGLLGCQDWEPRQTPLPTVDGAQAPPILVVGTVHDPATPYADAQDLTNMLESGALLTWEGEGHTAYPKTSCVTTAVDSYLLDLTVPAEGTTCPLT